LAEKGNMRKEEHANVTAAAKKNYGDLGLFCGSLG